MKHFLYLALVLLTVGAGTLAASQHTKHTGTKKKHKVQQHKKHKAKKTVQKGSVKKKKQIVTSAKKSAAASALASTSAQIPSAQNDNNVSAQTVSTAQKAEQKNTVVTRGDIKILEATENIRFLSQQIVKEYLLLFKAPRKDVVKERLKSELVALSNNLRVIGATTKDSDTKDILEFLAYSKDQIAQIFTESLKPEQAALMLDYSETLLEGADSIAAAHAYDFTKEEQMLMTAKKMEYLMERIMKYYMALHTGFDNPTNREQMHEAIAKFSQNLQQVEAYPYPKKIGKIRNEVTKAWWENGMYLGKTDTLFIPALMLLSTAHIEALITKIALFHNQNQ